MNYIIIIGIKFPIAESCKTFSEKQLKELQKVLYTTTIIPKLAFWVALIKTIFPKNILVKIYLYFYLYYDLQFIVKLIDFVFKEKHYLVSNTGELLQATKEINFGQFVEIDSEIRKCSDLTELSQQEIESLIALRFEIDKKKIKNITPYLSVDLVKNILQDYQNLIKCYKKVFNPDSITSTKKSNPDEWFKIIRLLADKNPLHFQDITKLSAAECLFHLQENIIEQEILAKQNKP